MRIVLDTNVLIAAFVARGLCHELLEHCARHEELFTSEYILVEFRRVLISKLKIPPRLADGAVETLHTKLTMVERSELETPVSRDPDDDPILGTALAAKAEILVTGDKDLLDLGTWQSMPIVSPSDFWRLQAQNPST